MIYLLLGIGCSAMISICMRISEQYNTNEMWMLNGNYFICSLLSFLFINTYSYESNTTITLGIISGVLYLTSLISLKYNMKKNGIILASTFMKLGILIPTLMAIFIFKEIPTIFQIAGIIIAIFAIILINFEKEDSSNNKNHLLLLLLLVLSGSCDSMANIFEEISVSADKDIYLFFTFFVAFLLSFLVSLKTKQKPSIKDYLFGFSIGIPNYFSSRFFLLALNELEAILVYPLYSISVLVIINLCGLIFFKEKLSIKKIIALVLILIAIALLNL